MTKLFDKLRLRFVTGARNWYRMWSSWLSVVMGVVVTIFWNDPSILTQLVDVMPGEVRAYLSPLVLGVSAALPIIVRLLKQQKLIKNIGVGGQPDQN